MDGDPHTLWHTRFSDGLASPPHELVIDMGKERTITALHYLARQDQGWNGSFGEISLSAGADAKTFPKPFVSHVFSKTKAPQVLKFETPITGRFIKLKIESEVNGKSWASAADIGFIEQ